MLIEVLQLYLHKPEGRQACLTSSPPFPPQRPMAGTRGGAEPEPSSPRPGPASPHRWRCCLGPRFVLGEAAELWVAAASCEA